MKSRIAPLLIALLTCGALMATGCSKTPEPTPTPTPQTKSIQKIEIGEYGTLKGLSIADGKNFDSKALGEGYAIGYQYQESAKAKPVEGFVYALGDEHSDNLEAVQEGQALAGENSVKAVVRTKDQALKITHEIAVDNTGGFIEIRRTVQALDKPGVQVSLVKLLNGSLLAGGKQITAGSSIKDLISGIALVGLSCHPCDCETIPPKYCDPNPPCTAPECCSDPPPAPSTPCPGMRGRWQFQGDILGLDQARKELMEKIKSKIGPLQLPVGAAYANFNQWTPLKPLPPMQVNNGTTTIIERIGVPH